MKVSYNWLQSHFKKQLPPVEEITNGLIFHSFEVEGGEKYKDGYVFDIKILPDRAHDCLCHLGVTREISAIFNIEKPAVPFEKLGNVGGKKSSVQVEIEDGELCRRYVGRVVRDIIVKDSGQDIKDKLESIGQKSINNIVDAANLIMFEIGQPLHAFDLDKIKGNIVVRNAKLGEKITTLDDREVELRIDTLVIADDVGPLAIAGVKGGKRAGVTKETKNIFLESANFNPVATRKTATKLNIHTDASKRFENDFPAELAMEAIHLFSGVLKAMASAEKTVFEDIIDIYKKPEGIREIFVTQKEISAILGIKLEKDEIVSILKRLDISATVENEKIKVISPVWRLDLNIKEDVAEEVGRINGYEKVPNLLPENKLIVKQNPEYLVVNKIKEFLFKQNFSEIYSYSFSEYGDVEIDKPLASDKKFLRKNITEPLCEKIEFNLRNSIFDQDPIRIFEIGNVYNLEGETKSLCFGVGYKTKKLNKSKAEIDIITANLLKELKIVQDIKPTVVEKENMTVVEFEMTDIFKLSLVDDFDLQTLINKDANYKKISQYPRSIRDIALFVPPEITSDRVENLIKENSGTLLVNDPILFDTFEKKDESGAVIKKSFAFRLIFQSYERTLLEQEINELVLGIIAKIEENQDWVVRK
ncbi:MAG: phenylalanine--tRNA ligase subunit beta [bacterium]